MSPFNVMLPVALSIIVIIMVTNAFHLSQKMGLAVVKRTMSGVVMRQRHELAMSSSGSKKKQKVVFLGTPDVASKSLEMIVEASKAPPLSDVFEVVAVVSNPPAPSGRKQKLMPSPVQVSAEKMNIPVMVPEKAKDEDFLEKLEEMSPDLCITAAYGQWLPKRFLAIPRKGTLNIHPSLLPQFRGAAPVQRCLERGDGVTGVSVAQTVLKMDAGPIVRQVTRALDGNEKADDLLLELFTKGTNALLDALPSYFDDENPIEMREQDDDAACPANKISVDEAKIDFSDKRNNAEVVHNKCRGYAIWPGIWSNFQIGNNEEVQRIKIITTRVLGAAGSSTPSEEVLVMKYQDMDGKGNTIGKKRDVLSIVCGDGSILGILELQPPGKKIMDAKSYINGLRGQTLKWKSLN